MSLAPDIEHRVLYRDPHFHTSFPSVVVRGDGTMLVAFRRARPLGVR